MHSAQKGFTLAEVLIALALLGVVAAFTIPKVLQASGTQEATAKVKETISALEQSWYNKKLQNTFVSGVGVKLYNNLADLNTVNQAVTAVDALNAPYNGVSGPIHPCMTGGAAATAKTGWMQMPNGVVISGLAGNSAADDIPADLSTATNNYLVCIDTNGDNTPNVLGTDVFLLNFNPAGSFVGGNGGTGSATSKNFSYGGAATAILNAAGGADILAAGAAGEAGLVLVQ